MRKIIADAVAADSDNPGSLADTFERVLMTGQMVEAMRRLAILASGTGRDVADLAAAAGVDADALRRHFDGQGPLSQIAYFRVMRAMLGTKTGTAWAP